MNPELEYAHLAYRVTRLRKQINPGAARPTRVVPTVSIVYQHPDGHTWDGKGRAPKWIRESEASGLPRAVWRIVP